MNQVQKYVRDPMSPSKVVENIRKWNKESPQTPPMAVKFVPKCDEWAQLYLNKSARVRSALVAVALERFRVHYNKGAWPKALAELTLVKDDPDNEKSPMILNAIPNDPYTDRELSYRAGKNGEGYVIYSWWTDGDDLGDFATLNTYAEHSDVGFRLWFADKRGKAAPAPG
jgi:hypothetical protein